MSENEADLSNNDILTITNGCEDELINVPFNLEIEELDEVEYQIPKINPPSLDSILNDVEDRLSVADLDSLSLSQGFPSTLGLAIEGSETQSVTSQRSRGTTADKKACTAFLRHVVLKGISSQIASAADRANAGLATTVAINGLTIAVGTTRGKVLIFDNRQSLRCCLSDENQGSVSSLALNIDSTRLLIGYARGSILMFDLTNGGKLLRTLTDVHTVGTAVLSLHFTDQPNLALCADSSGSVFELNFKRTLGVRGCDTKCLFSGSRGEVCALEPLLLFDIHHQLKGAVIVAMATLSKVIVISIRPQTRVIFVRPLLAGAEMLPLLAWQLVFVQNKAGNKSLDPVLAFAKYNVINFYQISVDMVGRLKVTALHKIELEYSLISIHWLNSWTLGLLDTAEKLHLVDVHSQAELEALDLSDLGLVYETSHFKGLATGGNVSKAFAKAGEKACYNTVVSQGSQLVVLSTRSLHAINIRPWAERLNHLVKQKKYLAALSLGLSFYEEPKSVLGLKGSRERRQDMTRGKVVQILEAFIEDLANPIDDIPAVIHYSIALHSSNIIFTKLWDAVFLNPNTKLIFLEALEPHILNDQLKSIPPLILQQFVFHYEQTGKYQALEACILHLDIQSLDLHQVVQICWAHSLYDAIIYIQNVAFNDYSTPIYELLPILQKALASGRKLTGKEVELGNKLLVYISCCLAGRGYPIGDIPKDVVSVVKHEVFKSITSLHSKDADDSELAYPYLRTLLQFDIREFLNVVSLAFTEPEFTTELGLRQRQRLVDILLQIVVHTPGFPAVEVGIFFTFLAGQLSRPLSGLQINVELFYPVFENLTDASNESFRNQREQVLVDLIRVAGLQNYPRDQLLARCDACKFYRVCELLYEQGGDWDKAFLCYFKDPMRKKQVFPYLRNIFLVYRNPGEISKLIQVVCDKIKDLLELDWEVTCGLILDHLMGNLDDLLKVLISDDHMKIEILEIALFSRNLSGDYESLIYKYIDLYVSLNIKLRPKSVVAVLKKYLDFFENAHMLSLVKTYGHIGGEVFLLEVNNRNEDAFEVVRFNLQKYLNDSSGSLESIQSLVEIGIGIVQGSFLKLGETEANQMWSILLDLLMSCNNSVQLPEKAKIKLIQEVLNGSVGYSNPACILDFILKHSSYLNATLGDIRNFLHGMLQNSNYEQRVAAITQRIVNHDLHLRLANLLQKSTRAVRTLKTECCVCKETFRNQQTFLYPCGHSVHESCAADYQCPVCYVLAVDKVESLAPEKRKLCSEDLESLKISAPPVADIEKIFK